MHDRAVQVGDGVWWVGATLEDDKFQCHAYLVVDGDDAVLIDPGSSLTLDSTLTKVAGLVPLESISAIVCHHADPDVCSALTPLSKLLRRPDVVVITEWRAEALLKHYGHRFAYYRIEENGWRYTMPGGRVLEFALTPYLHFPGAFVTFDPTSGVLLSSDLFGGFVPDSDVLVSSDVDYIVAAAAPFHQHYMPSSDLLRAGVRRLQRRWPDIARVAPQHGHIIDTDAVAPVLDAIAKLDCGVFALGDADLDLQRLVRLSQAGHHVEDAIATAPDIPALAGALDQIVRQTGLAAGCVLTLDAGGDAPPAHVLIDGDPPIRLSLRDAANDDATGELTAMLIEAGDRLRAAVDAHLAADAQAERIAELHEATLTDPLTGLMNRRALLATPPVGDYAVLALDLDRFKLVNDTFGHAAGDHVLRSVARALAASVRRQDHVYRIGGEELLITLPASDLGTARSIAERARTAVEALDLAGTAPDGRITVSIGAATSQHGVLSLAEVMANADRALYDAKTQGRNRTIAHDAAATP